MSLGRMMSVCDSPPLTMPPMSTDGASNTTLWFIRAAATAAMTPAGVAPYTATSNIALSCRLVEADASAADRNAAESIMVLRVPHMLDLPEGTV